ncbi:MAG: hypothetical protein JRJ06_09165, partial [Deltaproteobacteria bacterium]|nr:hypothetical protein [Deltaproteobacteria bacterium]
DLSDISLDSDLGTEEEAEPEEEISGEGISQVDLQDILGGDETNPDLDLTYDSSFEPEESLEDLMGEAELGETAATYEAEPEDEIGEEDISESDLEEILEESDSQMNMIVEAPLPS